MSPNFVVIMTDQQRADLRKSEGYVFDTMPFLDSLSTMGVDFTKAYTPNPICMAARTSMLTGRYAESHKVRTNHNREDALYTEDLLDVLKARGYVTALFGKNHSHRANSDFDFYKTNEHLGRKDDGRMTQAEREFNEFLNRSNHMESHVPSPGGVQVQHPYWNVTCALDFISQRPKDKPFFMWLSFAEPHNPSQVPEPYFDMFPPDSLPKPCTSAADLAAKGERYEWVKSIWDRVYKGDDEVRIKRTVSNYLGMLRLLDDQIKRFVDGLKAAELLENTYIVFVADHGDFVGEYGLVRKGPGLSEVLTRIPMLWVGPGIVPQGKNNTACVSLIDLLPTICDIIGVETPFGVQGRSLKPLLSGEPYPPHEFDTAYSESGYSGLFWNDNDGLDPVTEDACDAGYGRFDCLNTWTQCGQMRMVRKGDYKIELDMMGNGWLYDLSTDPAEVNNLWNNPEYAGVKAEMLSELAIAMMRAADPLPAPHKRYRVKRHPRGYWTDESYRCDDPGVLNLPPLSKLAAPGK